MQHFVLYIRVSLAHLTQLPITTLRYTLDRALDKSTTAKHRMVTQASFKLRTSDTTSGIPDTGTWLSVRVNVGSCRYVITRAVTAAKNSNYPCQSFDEF